MTIDQKIELFDYLFYKINCDSFFLSYLNSISFDIYFNLENSRCKQDVFNYFFKLLNDSRNLNIECNNNYYIVDLKIYKAIFHNEDYDFLLYCKNNLSQELINKNINQKFYFFSEIKQKYYYDFSTKA